MLGEGLAENVTEKSSIYYKYKFLSDVDDELRFWKCNGNEFIPIKELLEQDQGAHQRTLLYQQIHSFSRYIINNYGNDKFTELLLSNQTNNDFIQILGDDISIGEKIVRHNLLNIDIYVYG